MICGICQFIFVNICRHYMLTMTCFELTMAHKNYSCNIAYLRELALQDSYFLSEMEPNMHENFSLCESEGMLSK